MAIIDRNCIFFEGPLTGPDTGNVVALTALTLPGRMEPMPLRISVTEAFDPAELASLGLALEEAGSAEAAEADWTEVPGASWTYPGPRSASARAWGRASCRTRRAAPASGSGSRRWRRRARRSRAAASSRPCCARTNSPGRRRLRRSSGPSLQAGARLHGRPRPNPQPRKLRKGEA